MHEFVAAYTDVLQTERAGRDDRLSRLPANDYQGHDPPGVSANPDGAACYAASVRSGRRFQWMPKTFTGRACQRWRASKAKCCRSPETRSAPTTLRPCLAELRTNPQYTFQDEQDMLDYVNGSGRARQEPQSATGLAMFPTSKLIIIPSPAVRKKFGRRLVIQPRRRTAARPAPTWSVRTSRPTSARRAWSRPHFMKVIRDIICKARSR